jgi:hypothetical protein
VPLHDLLELVEADPSLYLRPRSEPSLVRHVLWRDDRLAVVPVGYVVQSAADDDPTEGDWVKGLVVANPFQGRGPRAPEATPDWWPAHLAESELLVCALRSWHPLGEPRNDYKLERAEWAETAKALILRLVANW